MGDHSIQSKILFSILFFFSVFLQGCSILEEIKDIALLESLLIMEETILYASAGMFLLYLSYGSFTILFVIHY